ncbi:hypothetical protein PISMIDRAFT_118021 [Pisolithus microcarpus 441]|uniref:Uncharacterized protein n=2 Tax=Pisolithus microcarpus 441 TaxID=765257 RepID=A0A0C9YAP8_9AGAM|nr:hypothetical protein PISMIDRAFT_118021 [Pisolithus microcarpus 441]
MYHCTSKFSDLKPQQIRKLAYKIINSLTILLPAWDVTCKDVSLSVRWIPHDVSTHWNSSFDMLDIMISCHGPVDAITDK